MCRTIGLERGRFVGVPASYRRGKTSAFTIEIICSGEMTIYWSSFHGHAVTGFFLEKKASIRPRNHSILHSCLNSIVGVWIWAAL
jgi:hypothetical protein